MSILKICGFTVICSLALYSFILVAGPVTDNQILQGNNAGTSITPALNNLIDQSIAQKKHNKALDLLNTELKKDPTNTELLYKKAALYADLEQYSNSIDDLKKIQKLQPNNKQANKLRDIVEEKKRALPHNEIGFDQDEAFVSDLKAFWSYSSLHYYRITDNGNVGMRMNFSSRNATTAEQYLVEAYPKLFKSAWAELTLGYANSTQILFPTFQYTIEAYFDIPFGLEVSLGQGTQRYKQFSNQKIVSYTGTIGKFIKDYFIWVRPSYYTPKSTEFYELGLRRTFNNPNANFTFKLSAGKLPDIGDIPPLDKMIEIKQKGVNLNGQYPLTKTFFLMGGLGYTRQVFPSDLLREVSDVSIGFVKQF